MRKFKIISTCAALVLMVALMAFGVYAAANSFTLSVSGTISFKCTDVYIKVNYGLLLGETNTASDNYYSQPGDPVTWKKSPNDTTTVSFATLPAAKFTEENTTCTYYLTVQNLHGMPIYFNFGYLWENSNENNVITALGAVYSGEHTSTTVAVAATSFSNGISGVMEIAANATYTLKVDLTLDKQDYVAGGEFTFAAAAALNQGDAVVTF